MADKAPVVRRAVGEVLIERGLVDKGPPARFAVVVLLVVIFVSDDGGCIEPPRGSTRNLLRAI